MSAEIEAAPGGTTRRDAYPVSLQHAAAALWGDGFWGREAPARDERADNRKPARR